MGTGDDEAIAARARVLTIQRILNAVAGLLVLAAVVIWPHAIVLSLVLTAVGLGAGYLLYRHRFRGRVLPIVSSVIVFALLGLLCLGVASAADAPGSAFVIIPGGWFGLLAARRTERAFGATHRIVVRLWRGVERVGAGAVTFAVTALTASVSRKDVAGLRAHTVVPSVVPDVVRRGFIGAVAYVVMPVGVLAMVTGISLEVGTDEQGKIGQLLGMSAVLLLMLLAATILMWWTVRTRGRTTNAKKHVRFARFARDNGLTYNPVPVGRDGHTLTRLMRRGGARPLLVANAENVGTGRGTTHFTSLCELGLMTQLPNILLVSRRNWIPAFSSYTAPAQAQRLSLEGDFDRYYELYCPAGYERDALYLFTPDVMAALIDDVHGFDVELVDSHLVLRARRDIVTADPTRWAALARALDALGGRIQQWERWRDERTLGERSRLTFADINAPGTVGRGGRRLRQGVGAGMLLAVGFGAIYLALTVLANSM